MSIKKITILLMFVSILASCKREPPTNIELAPFLDNTVDHDLKNSLKKLYPEVTIDSIEFGSHLLIVINYPKKSTDQIALMAMAAKNWAPFIFKNDEINSFALFYQLGIEDFNLRHFMVVEKSDWLVSPAANTVFDWYNLANRYYIGPAVTGNLTFKLGNVDVYLPVQKPIN